jgi:hypothetical protein
VKITTVTDDVSQPKKKRPVDPPPLPTHIAYLPSHSFSPIFTFLMLILVQQSNHHAPNPIRLKARLNHGPAIASASISTFVRATLLCTPSDLDEYRRGTRPPDPLFSSSTPTWVQQTSSLWTSDSVAIHFLPLSNDFTTQTRPSLYLFHRLQS